MLHNDISFDFETWWIRFFFIIIIYNKSLKELLICQSFVCFEDFLSFSFLKINEIYKLMKIYFNLF